MRHDYYTPNEHAHFLEVLRAAEAVLAARENQMLTSEDWDALAHAVAAANEPLPDERIDTFSIVDGMLIRSVVPKRGKPYQHSCEQDVFETVAHAIEDFGTDSFNLEDVRAKANVPWTQAAVALAFLRERGCIVPTVRRKHVAAASGLHLDAMVEWHALREKPDTTGG